MRRKNRGIRRYVLSGVVGSVYLFMYTPILALALFSFNRNPFSYDWQGFTTEWYRELFSSIEVWEALKNSLIVASFSVANSLVLALFFVSFAASIYLHRLTTCFYSILAIPEIVLAVAMLSFFSLYNVHLSITTLIAGHTLLGLGYTVPIILNRFVALDKCLVEVSKDLGATRMQTFFRITLPLLLPSLVVSGFLVFIISFDDFVFSFFCSGASAQTLPLYIFSLIRAGSTPMVNALSTLLLIASNLLVLLLFLLLTRKTGMVR